MPIDKRSFEIKRKLREYYPLYKYKVKIKKYSLGESIWIYTDMIKKLPDKPVEEMTEKEKIQRAALMKRNQEAREEIERILASYSHVRRCEFSGEILSGGNTFLFVEPL